MKKTPATKNRRQDPKRSKSARELTKTRKAERARKARFGSAR